MLSNPPYGKSWKTDLQRMGGKKEMRDPCQRTRVCTSSPVPVSHSIIRPPIRQRTPAINRGC